jgi:hypothetical protein
VRRKVQPSAASLAESSRPIVPEAPVNSTGLSVRITSCPFADTADMFALIWQGQ